MIYLGLISHGWNPKYIQCQPNPVRPWPQNWMICTFHYSTTMIRFVYFRPNSIFQNRMFQKVPGQVGNMLTPVGVGGLCLRLKLWVRNHNFCCKRHGYGRHEMPKKACERWFCHVIAFAYLFEMPQNRRISFSVPFLF